jgi:hypothetical protein
VADWYVSSVAWAAISQFAASHAYSIGDVVRPLTTPAAGKEYAFRCTTAGTSSTEPAWPTANNGTVATGGATFTNVTGQSTYGWGAAAGTLFALTYATAFVTRPVVGDRVFLSSDHSESVTGDRTYAFNTNTGAFGVIEFLSVNRAGSVPPVAADLTAGAAISITSTASNSLTLDAYCSYYWQGVNFSVVGASAGAMQFNTSGTKVNYLKNCAISFANGSMRSGNTAKVVFDNTTVQFGAAGNSIQTSTATFDLVWLNTSSAVVGPTYPTNLFTLGSGQFSIACRGVDLSAITGTLVAPGSGGGVKALFDSCKIASSVVRYPSSSGTLAVEEVELVNCWDGTNVLNERYTPAGGITTDHSTYLSGGAQDDVGNYSLKLVSNTRSDFCALPLDCFIFDVENTPTGSSKTATVEIISSGTLNNNDIRLLLEYMGASGNPVASFVDSLATVLTAASALSSSSSTWNSPPSTPQKQLLQATFTPQRAGRVRGLVRLGKVSSTVWINPQIAIT